MAKIKFICPVCGRALQCDGAQGDVRVKCRHCKHVFLAPTAAPHRHHSPLFRQSRKWVILGIIAVAVWMLALTTILIIPARNFWPDRRPIGVLMLASHAYSSAKNPRGWFNDPALDVTGTNGLALFRAALFDYVDRSIPILKRVGAQGAIIWDLEGEQFPHKTSYIGDPRLVAQLAPEMAPVVDEFFARFKNAGFRVGVTVRPQNLVFDDYGIPRQKGVVNIKRCLEEKINFARNRWGASLFYIDSNAGVRRPDEAWQLRSLAAEHPDVLLIPEHHHPLYQPFSAGYVALRGSTESAPPSFGSHFFSHSFRVLDIADANHEENEIMAAQAQGDVLLFRAWFWNAECELLERLAPLRPKTEIH